MKAVGMRIRVEQELRDAFIAACQKLDMPAAQNIRQHMKRVVRQSNSVPKQKSLQSSGHESQ